MTGDFSTRRFLIVGAAKGIGRACVERLVAAGASVGCVDRDAQALAELAKAMPVARPGAKFVVQAADVTDTDAVTGAVDRIAEELGGLDGVINAAGIDLVSTIEDMSDADWARVMAVNLTGPMVVCRAAFAHLKKADGATIVNVSSGAGLQPLKLRTAYSASKAGLQMFSKALSMEAADYKIRVNTVCPGAVDTELFRSSLAGLADPEAALDDVRGRYALARIADADEIAAAILWLSSKDASYVTGTALAVDGGRTYH